MSTATPNAFLVELQSLFYELTISRYMAAAGLSVMLYDWALTLSVEIRYIWRARWTPVKVVFLINRYFMPCTIAFGIYGWSGKATWITRSTCKAYIVADAYSVIAFFCTLHWIVAMRTWALWSRTVVMGVVIWGSFAIYLSAAVATTAKAMIDYQPTPLFGTNVCVGNLPSYFWCLWLPSIVFETVLFVLTAIKAIQHHRKRVETPILTTLYRDGFLYFVFICLNSFMNLLIWAVAPPGYVILYKFFSTSICAVAGAHLVLDLIHVGHITGASQKSGQPPPGIKGVGFGYAHEHGEVFEMMSAPSFMQDPPDYNQTIDQAQSRSFTNWVAPAEWESYHGHESSAANSAATNTTTRSRTELLTWSEQLASRDNYSLTFLPSRTKRKGAKLRRSNPRQTVSSPGTYPPERPRLVISTPVPHSFTKNGASSTPYTPRTPHTPPPAFSSPTTYRQQLLQQQQQQQLQLQQLQQQLQQVPYASGSQSPPPQTPITPSRERSVKFSQQQYRSSPQAI